MTDIDHGHDKPIATDLAPGDETELDSGITHGVASYVLGLSLAGALTAGSFLVASGGALIWPPAIPAALIALALAQIGIHLVFFLHITTGPDNANNMLALAFGVLIVVLVVGGSLWIMANLNHNMMPADDVMQMQR